MSAFPLPGFEDDGRHLRNGHTISLGECVWRCETCGHTFDAAADAEWFACGEDCTGKHQSDWAQCGDERARNTPDGRLLRALFPNPGAPAASKGERHA